MFVLQTYLFTSVCLVFLGSRIQEIAQEPLSSGYVPGLSVSCETPNSIGLYVVRLGEGDPGHWEIQWHRVAVPLSHSGLVYSSNKLIKQFHNAYSFFNPVPGLCWGCFACWASTLPTPWAAARCGCVLETREIGPVSKGAHCRPSVALLLSPGTCFCLVLI